MNLKSKILTGYIILMLFFVGISGLSIFQSANSENDYDYLNENIIAVLGTVDEIKAGIAGQANDERGFLITGDNQFAGEIDEKAEAVQKNIDKFLEMADGEKKSLMLQVKKIHTEFTEIQHKVIDNYKNGDLSEAKKLSFETGREKRKGLDPVLKKIKDLIKKDSDTIHLNMDKTIHINKTIIIIINIIAIIMGICISIYITYRVINPIKDAAAVMDKLAEKDLTVQVQVQSSDEIGMMQKNINSTVGILEDTIKRLYNSVKNVSNAASEISSGNEDLSQRTQEQAASLEETSSAIEELTATVKQNAENAQKANNMSNEVAEVVTKGNSIVKETISAMENATSSSKRINEIIGVVNEIAFQTNLLALNAAVEAARAGEQGRGFAVVASEVRNLAKRSGEAAKEIQNLIKDSVDKIQNGNELVLKTGSQLDVITDKVNEMSALISEIAAASKEQSVGIDEVNKAITQMDQVTQQNAALVEESAASSQAMNHEAQELLSLASQFKVNEVSSNKVEVTTSKGHKRNAEKIQNKKGQTDSKSFEGFEKF